MNKNEKRLLAQLYRGKVVEISYKPHIGGFIRMNAYGTLEFNYDNMYRVAGNDFNLYFDFNEVEYEEVHYAESDDRFLIIRL